MKIDIQRVPVPENKTTSMQIDIQVRTSASTDQSGKTDSVRSVYMCAPNLQVAMINPQNATKMFTASGVNKTFLADADASCIEGKAGSQTAKFYSFEAVSALLVHSYSKEGLIPNRETTQPKKAAKKAKNNGPKHTALRKQLGETKLRAWLADLYNQLAVHVNSLSSKQFPLDITRIPKCASQRSILKVKSSPKPQPQQIVQQPLTQSSRQLLEQTLQRVAMPQEMRQALLKELPSYSEDMVQFALSLMASQPQPSPENEAVTNEPAHKKVCVAASSALCFVPPQSLFNPLKQQQGTSTSYDDEKYQDAFFPTSPLRNETNHGGLFQLNTAAISQQASTPSLVTAPELQGPPVAEFTRTFSTTLLQVDEPRAQLAPSESIPLSPLVDTESLELEFNTWFV